MPLCFPYVEKGETDARCNPYNVTPKRARNSNIMDSIPPHRNTRALYISPCMLLYCRFQPSLLIRHDGERAGKTYRALAPSCFALAKIPLDKSIPFRTKRRIFQGIFKIALNDLDFSTITHDYPIAILIRTEFLLEKYLYLHDYRVI